MKPRARHGFAFDDDLRRVLDLVTDEVIEKMAAAGERPQSWIATVSGPSAEVLDRRDELERAVQERIDVILMRERLLDMMPTIVGVLVRHGDFPLVQIEPGDPLPLVNPPAGAQWKIGASRFEVTASAIGRGVTPALADASRRVGGIHCEVVAGPGTWLVRDLGSRNGTELNGVPLNRSLSPLRHGDSLKLGGVALLEFSQP